MSPINLIPFTLEAKENVGKINNFKIRKKKIPKNKKEDTTNPKPL